MIQEGTGKAAATGPIRRGQDRHDHQLRRRVVRRLGQQVHRRRLGGLPEQARAHDDRLRRRPGASAGPIRPSSGTTSWSPRWRSTRAAPNRPRHRKSGNSSTSTAAGTTEDPRLAVHVDRPELDAGGRKTGSGSAGGETQAAPERGKHEAKAPSPNTLRRRTPAQEAPSDAGRLLAPHRRGQPRAARPPGPRRDGGLTRGGWPPGRSASADRRRGLCRCAVPVSTSGSCQPPGARTEPDRAQAQVGAVLLQRDPERLSRAFRARSRARVRGPRVQAVPRGGQPSPSGRWSAGAP